MTLARVFRANTRIDHDDLDGLLSVLDRDIAAARDVGGSAAFYRGARTALSIIRHHEFVDTQADFMRLLDRYREEQGGELWE